MSVQDNDLVTGSVLPPCPIAPSAICDEVADLLARGLPKEKSIVISKRFNLSYETPGFSLLPPKLDDWMSQRAS